MKKYIYVVIIICMLVSCSHQNEIDNLDSVAPEKIPSDNHGEMKILIPELRYLVPDVGFIWEWQEYMRNKYDLDIELEYVTENNLGDIKEGLGRYLGIDIDDVRRSLGSGGFVYLDRVEDIIRMIESGLIVPVNEYISQIPSLSILEDIVFKQFADSDENIWAIPLEQHMVGTYRIYNNEWISKWGKGIPFTTEEFLDYAYYVRDNDLDGNGETDSYILALNEAYFFYEIEDILRSFGCYSDNGQPIGFNPKTMGNELVLLNENFPEAFSFIKNLYDEGLIIKTEKRFSERVEEPYTVASANQHEVSSFLESESLVVGQYIIGTNKTDLIRYKSGSNCFVVLAGTENISEKMNRFFNMLSKNQDAFQDMSSGIKGKSYYDYDDYYTSAYYDENEKRNLKIGIWMDLDSDKISSKPSIFSLYENDFNKAYIKNHLNSIKTHNAIIPIESDLYKTDKAYTVNYLNDNWTINDINNEIYQYTIEILSKMLNGLVSIEEGLEQYRSTVKSMGIFEKLDEVN